MATLVVNARFISEDLEELRAIGRTIDVLLGGDNASGIRLHYDAGNDLTTPVNGYSLYPPVLDRSRITHGGQEVEGLLNKLDKNLRTQIPALAEIPPFTEGVRVLGEGRRWRIDYGQLLANISEYVAKESIVAEFYTVIGEILSKERLLHEEQRI